MSIKHRKVYFNLAKEIVISSLKNQNFNVFVFGGRAIEPYKRNGDLDIGIWGDEPVSAKTKIELEEVLNESMVPWKVDIVDFYYVSEAFKNATLNKILVWKKVNDLIGSN